MASKFGLFTRRFFISANIIVVIIFLLACLVPNLNPQSWWFISFLGLVFPFLLLLVLFFLLGWLIVGKPRLMLISGTALLFGIKGISVLFAFHKPATFDYKKPPHSIRVVTWNVARFIELKRNANKGSQIRLKMMEQLKKQDADILCLQEFHTAEDSVYYNNIKAVQELGFPYYYFSFDEDGDKLYYSSIIFSRYPIIDSGMIRYPRPSLPEVLMHADIKMNEDTVRVYTTHLQSIQFNNRDYKKLGEIKTVSDSLLSNSKTIFSKVKRGISYRSIQADIINEVVMNSPLPVIFCADLNDVPNSYTYTKVKGNMQDAFLKKGFGIGRTFSGISPTLRIDYILTGKQFKIIQFNRVVKKLSDHYMLVADMELKK